MPLANHGMGPVVSGLIVTSSAALLLPCLAWLDGDMLDLSDGGGTVVGTGSAIGDKIALYPHAPMESAFRATGWCFA